MSFILRYPRRALWKWRRSVWSVQQAPPRSDRIPSRPRNVGRCPSNQEMGGRACRRSEKINQYHPNCIEQKCEPTNLNIFSIFLRFITKGHGNSFTGIFLKLLQERICYAFIYHYATEELYVFLCIQAKNLSNVFCFRLGYPCDNCQVSRVITA